MRWLTNKNPEIGDVGQRRSVTKFAWLPVIARRYKSDEKQYKVWLEFYDQFQIVGVEVDDVKHVLRPTWKPIDNDPNWIY